MASDPAIDFSNMSLSERILLAQDLWDSIARDAEDLPIPEWQREELERRLRRLDRGDVQSRPWAEVLAEAKERLRQS